MGIATTYEIRSKFEEEPIKKNYARHLRISVKKRNFIAIINTF